MQSGREPCLTIPDHLIPRGQTCSRKSHRPVMQLGDVALPQCGVFISGDLKKYKYRKALVSSGQGEQTPSIHPADRVTEKARTRSHDRLGLRSAV
jgi:hypothetical protein